MYKLLQYIYTNSNKIRIFIAHLFPSFYYEQFIVIRRKIEQLSYSIPATRVFFLYQLRYRIKHSWNHNYLIFGHKIMLEMIETTISIPPLLFLVISLQPLDYTYNNIQLKILETFHVGKFNAYACKYYLTRLVQLMRDSETAAVVSGGSSRISRRNNQWYMCVRSWYAWMNAWYSCDDERLTAVSARSAWHDKKKKDTQKESRWIDF